jgi:hypothetical protein
MVAFKPDSRIFCSHLILMSMKDFITGAGCATLTKTKCATAARWAAATDCSRDTRSMD